MCDKFQENNLQGKLEKGSDWDFTYEQLSKIRLRPDVERWKCRTEQVSAETSSGPSQTHAAARNQTQKSRSRLSFPEHRAVNKPMDVTGHLSAGQQFSGQANKDSQIWHLKGSIVFY